MKKILPVACLSIVLSACGTVAKLDPSAALPTEEESIFILGVNPANFEVYIFPGEVRNGKFHKSSWRSAAAYGAPSQGYLVGKVKAGDILAITMVRYTNPDNIWAGRNFVPCNQVPTMVFKVPQGKVVYLGTVDYQVGRKSITIRYGNDIHAAQQYVAKTYPALQGELGPFSPEFMPMAGECSSDVYLPLYLKR
jgi:hypothetical protein